jgi:hypothetical protein
VLDEVVERHASAVNVSLVEMAPNGRPIADSLPECGGHQDNQDAEHSNATYKSFHTTS